MPDSLLIEILTEELPPKSLARLADALGRHVADELGKQGLLSTGSRHQTFATPRRLAVRVTGVLSRQDDRMLERRGPAVSAGLDAAGKPTPALLGFARSCGVKVGALSRRAEGKGEYFVHRAKQKGEPLRNLLADIVQRSLKRLPVARLMRWGAGEEEFVRPVHGVVMLHARRVVPGKVMGLKSGNKTRGHRFMSRGQVVIKHADDYEKILERRGCVVAGLEERVRRIRAQLNRHRKKGGKTLTWNLGQAQELVDEVASLVEFPAVYAGGFDEAFLAIPRECLIIAMEQHQKYFPLADARGGLQPRFLFVSNTKTAKPKLIIEGNERVLKARLADAKFFYDQDRKTRLADRVQGLAGVVYHSKLGSQLERVERIGKSSVEIAARLGFDTAATEAAARLCKADLLTEMVGEFPELQGIMGYYYARHDGFPEEVASAIMSHYQPRTADDEPPRPGPGLAIALADKLDTLVGMFGIGLAPTGEKDPFGLRRQALGVVRILIERAQPLDVHALIELAAAAYPPGRLSREGIGMVYAFMLDRLRPYLRDKGFAPDEIESVLCGQPALLDQVVPRLEALQSFRRLPEAGALAAANKRIRNILRQADYRDAADVSDRLLREDAERKLARAVAARRAALAPLLQAQDYSGALKELAGLRGVVDEFFDQVMVMVDDPEIRGNRLALLQGLKGLFMRIADISRLQS